MSLWIKECCIHGFYWNPKVTIPWIRIFLVIFTNSVLYEWSFSSLCCWRKTHLYFLKKRRLSCISRKQFTKLWFWNLENNCNLFAKWARRKFEIWGIFECMHPFNHPVIWKYYPYLMYLGYFSFSLFMGTSIIRVMTDDTLTIISCNVCECIMHV